MHNLSERLEKRSEWEDWKDKCLLLGVTCPLRSFPPFFSSLFLLGICIPTCHPDYSGPHHHAQFLLVLRFPPYLLSHHLCSTIVSNWGSCRWGGLIWWQGSSPSEWLHAISYCRLLLQTFVEKMGCSQELSEISFQIQWSWLSRWCCWASPDF